MYVFGAVCINIGSIPVIPNLENSKCYFIYIFI